MEKFIERYQVCEGFLPVNMATAANPGDYVSMADYESLVILFFKGPGAAGEPPTITLDQATSNGGAGSKALTFTELWTKKAATNLQGVASYTRVTQAAAASYTDTASTGDQALLLVIEVTADMLDTNGGFKFVRATVADVGATAQTGCVLYIGRKPRYAQETLPSMLA